MNGKLQVKSTSVQVGVEIINSLLSVKYVGSGTASKNKGNHRILKRTVCRVNYGHSSKNIHLRNFYQENLV